MHRSGTAMAWNVFRFCTALRGLGSIMILLVLGVVGVTYYAVVLCNYWNALYAGGFTTVIAVAVLLLFHFLLLGVVGVTYYAVVLCNYWNALYAGGFTTLVAVAVLLLFHFLEYHLYSLEYKPTWYMNCHRRVRKKVYTFKKSVLKLVMLLWSYFSVVFTDPGTVPPNWRPVLDEERGDTDLLAADVSNISADSTNPRIRYCRKCNQLKPPRCHHCSVCGRCVLKMDHHCVWVVNCVGALNYKYFLLFLFYTFLETTVVTLSLLPHFIAFFSDEEIPGTPGMLATTFLAFVLNLAFALSVLGFLIMHISLVAGNTTTIEAYEKKTTPKWRYDLGRKRNFEQVFGTDKLYWFMPSYSEEDLRRMPALQGLDYPSRPGWDSQAFE